MHRPSFQTRAIAALMVAFLLPATMVDAQTPPSGTPAPGAFCTPAETDPTDGNSIEFIRLAGPPDNREDGPSLYRVNFLDEGAVFLAGCDSEAIAVHASLGTMFLRAFEDGTTSVFFAAGIPDEVAGHCEEISEPPEHETRTGCVLAADGVIAPLGEGDGAFHEAGATYAYAYSAETLGQFGRSGPTNAKMTGIVPGRGNEVVRLQSSHKSIDIASSRKKPTGCGAECI